MGAYKDDIEQFDKIRGIIFEDLRKYSQYSKQEKKIINIVEARGVTMFEYENVINNVCQYVKNIANNKEEFKKYFIKNDGDAKIYLINNIPQDILR